MKNLLCISLIFFTIISLNAQVGIGTNAPNAGAELDIVSSDKGILIPRLESTAVTSPVDGMMIYQPSDQSFYYYKDTAWTNIGGGVSSEMVDADGDTKISLVEGARDSIIFSLDGVEQLKFVKSSSGSFRMEQLNNNSNVAFGERALMNNYIGYENIAIGYESLNRNVEGCGNIAIGKNALFFNTNGIHNTVIGAGAGSHYYGDSSVFIGMNAGSFATGSNELFIENSYADKNSALIYGDFDNDRLRVNNKLGIGTSSSGYPLSIRGNVGNDLIMFKDNLDGSQWHLKLTNNNLNFVESAVAENRLVLTEGGNIGIGLVNPEKSLHIKDGSNPTIKLQSDGISEESGRISLRQSNDSGVDMYYDGIEDELIFESFTSGSSNGKIVTFDQASKAVTIHNLTEIENPRDLGVDSNGKIVVDKPLAIGDFIHGGIVAWIDDSGEHGYVLALDDVEKEPVWCATGNPWTRTPSEYLGAAASGIGAGYMNTIIIVSGNKNISSAAEHCLEYISGNYGDWFLPSYFELLEVHHNLTAINNGLSAAGGDIMSGFYWTSAELGDLFATMMNIDDGVPLPEAKVSCRKTRAMRPF